MENGFDDEAPVPDEKVEQAIFGEEVRQFLENDRVGQYLVRKAQAEVEDAMVELKDVDADNPNAIRRIQMRIRVAESVVGWLAAAVDDGLRARQILEDEG